MSYYNFIKTVILIFLIYLIPATIGQVSQVFYLLRHGFEYSSIFTIAAALLSTLFYTFLLFLLIWNIDKALKFLRIDRLYSPEERIEWNFKNSNWISLIFIYLGLDMLFNYLPNSLIQSARFFSQHTREGLGGLIYEADQIDGMVVFSNLLFVALGFMLVYYSKSLGLFVKKKVIDETEITQ